MSYPIDLDEYSEDRLKGELARRKKLRAKGLCDYCERSWETKPCAQSDRHSDSRIVGVKAQT